MIIKNKPDYGTPPFPGSQVSSSHIVGFFYSQGCEL